MRLVSPNNLLVLTISRLTMTNLNGLTSHMLPIIWLNIEYYLTVENLSNFQCLNI